MIIIKKIRILFSILACMIVLSVSVVSVFAISEEDYDDYGIVNVVQTINGHSRLPDRVTLYTAVGNEVLYIANAELDTEAEFQLQADDVVVMYYDAGIVNNCFGVFRNNYLVSGTRVFDMGLKVNGSYVNLKTYMPALADYLDYFNVTVGSEFVPISDGFANVWNGIKIWLISALAALSAIFWVNGSLTFVGILAVVGLGIGVVFLIIGFIQKFLRMRS